MVAKEMKLLMGEGLYKLKTGKELYARAEEYRDKFAENCDDTESGQIFLNYAYAAFMEGYATPIMCHDIGIMVTSGFVIPGHNRSESEDIAAAILQYGVEELHSPDCAEQISMLYKNGTSGIIQANKSLEWKWLNRAAQSGCSSAQVNLGCQLFNKNKYYDAEEFWLAAANQGSVDAMHNLGVLYEGDGFWDYSQAGYWYEQAARNGDKDAEKTLRKRYVYDQKRQKWLKRM